MLLLVATVTLLVHQIRHFFTSPQEVMKQPWSQHLLSLQPYHFFQSSFLIAWVYNEHIGVRVPIEARRGHLIH